MKKALPLLALLLAAPAFGQATNTPTATVTNTPTATSTNTATLTPTRTPTNTKTFTPITGNPAASLNSVLAATGTGVAMQTNGPGVNSVWFHVFRGDGGGFSDGVVNIEQSLDNIHYAIQGTASWPSSTGETWVCPASPWSRTRKTAGTVGAITSMIWTSPQVATYCHRTNVVTEPTPLPYPTPTP